MDGPGRPQAVDPSPASKPAPASRAAEAVVVDLSDVTFLDCSALGILVGLADRCVRGGEHFLLCGPQAVVRRMLGALHLDRVFVVTRTVTEAICLAESWRDLAEARSSAGSIRRRARSRPALPAPTVSPDPVHRLPPHPDPSARPDPSAPPGPPARPAPSPFAGRTRPGSLIPGSPIPGSPIPGSPIPGSPIPGSPVSRLPASRRAAPLPPRSWPPFSGTDTPSPGENDPRGRPWTI